MTSDQFAVPQVRRVEEGLLLARRGKQRSRVTPVRWTQACGSSSVRYFGARAIDFALKAA